MAKREAYTAMKNREYESAAGALYDINAMLPKDKERNYQVEISDIKYDNAVKHDVILVCNNCTLNCKHCIESVGDCKAEVLRNDVQINEVMTDRIVYTLTGKRTEKVWYCKKCNSQNLFSRTKRIQTMLKEPYFLKVIPSQPVRKNGILDRKNYHKNFRAWFILFMNELSYQMSRYRLEYVPKDFEQKEDEVLDGQEHLDSF